MSATAANLSASSTLVGTLSTASQNRPPRPARGRTSLSTGSTLIGTPSVTPSTNRFSQVVQNRKAKPTAIADATNLLVTNAQPTQGLPVVGNVWEEALKNHLAKLKPKDRAFCLQVQSNSTFDQEAMKRIFNPLQNKYESAIFHRIIERVGPICTHIMSFGRAVDVAVGQGPMAAGFIWGGMRLLLDVCGRSADMHDKLLDMLETLSTYLQLFEEWINLFPAQNYTQLADCIRKTCIEFVAFLFEAILNIFRVLFSPGLHDRFSRCEEKIKLYTRHLDLQITTAGFKSSKNRDQQMLDLLQKSAAKPSAPPAVVFPFRFLQNCIRNDQFFGQRTHMAQLDSHFSAKNSGLSMRSVVIHGLGGCGKSSLAKEYMYIHYENYKVILWLYADAASKLNIQYIHLARSLGFTTSETYAREAVLQWINHLSVPFLVVFDNADDPSILSTYWPNSVYGSVIITSRNPATREEGFAQHGLHLKEFDEEQGTKFLLSLLDEKFRLSKDDMLAAKKLVQQFGGLPLALRQAASFMRNKKCQPAQFAAIYQSRFQEIEQYTIPNYPKTLVNVWNMSLSTLSEDSLTLLHTLALFDPDSIPTELFHSPNVSHPFGEFMRDPLRVLDAIEGLTSQSLVDHNEKEEGLNVHRFFQTATFRKLSQQPERFGQIVQFAVELIQKILPEDDLSSVRQPKRWKAIERALSHVESVYSRCLGTISERGSEMLLRCLADLLNYGFESGQYGVGEQAFRKAQALVKKITNPDHHLLSRLYFYHARLCQEENRSHDALETVQLASHHMDEAIKTDPGLLNSTLYVRILSNQGIVHLAVEKYAESEMYHKRAIAHCVKMGMQEQCSIGNLTQNLGSCYLWSGDLAKAEPTLRRALKQPNKNAEGAKYTMGNLLLRLQKYDEALALHKEVLHTYIEDLGPDHLTTSDSWHKLGSIFCLPEFPGRDLKGAEKALEICERPINTQNLNSLTFVARAKWRLSQVLDPSSKEASQLRDEALVYLRSRFDGQIPDGKDPSELFDSLVFYWSR
ncbi:hypothetical protein ACJ72_03830 [Emergomyces africanus]|uniref:DUF7779 domain-containing protein n=1 Tax=Emergomyces africanus TaxID=1955775 RepID=A0A1B7NZ03_9EURO|nr:hypothetical protein ACJ72_03830 [Emergomyces africanus]